MWQINSRRGSLEDEEIEGLQGKVYESPRCMSEETTEVRTHHTLPATSIHLVKLLLDVGSNRYAIKNVMEIIKDLRSTSHGLHVHLFWHVCFLYASFPFQHLSFLFFSPLSLSLSSPPLDSQIDI